MADTDSSSAQKRLVYDLLYQLNASFRSRSHLLGAMRRIEQRDRERFSQPHNEQVF